MKSVKTYLWPIPKIVLPLSAEVESCARNIVVYPCLDKIYFNAQKMIRDELELRK